MTAMGAAAALLALLLAVCVRLGRPEACRRAQLADGTHERSCSFPAGRLILQFDNQELKITCRDGQLQCPDQLSQMFPLARDTPLPKLKVVECRLRGPLACWLNVTGARSVRTLVLESVQTALAAEHVAGLDGVRELKMLYKGDIPSEALTSLPSVENFSLTLADYPRPSLLKGLNLKYLKLSDDRIETLAAGALQLGQLRHLRLSNNEITDITEDTFIGLRALQTLELRGNKLRALPAHVFRHTPRLARLDVGANSIQTVHRDAFRGLRELNKIDASNNHVTLLLSSRCLSNLASLQEIALDHSHIESLPSDLFHNSTQLRSISLAGNQIAELPADLFRDQRALRTLDLSRNKIKQLASNIFHSLEKLVELNLNDNCLSELNKDLFPNLSDLRTLRINNNQLSLIEFSVIGLTHVSLADNQLSFDCGKSHSRQSPLNALHGSLAHLDLSGNNISRICGDWQNLLRRLQLLNLSRNAIEELADADLQFYSNSILVDLRNNRIARVALSNPSAKISYHHILLDGNPFICDCKNQNFFDYTRINEIPKLDVGNASCVGPPQLSGKLVRNINPWILTCPLGTGCPAECSCAVRPAARHLELTCSSLPPALPGPAELPEYSLNGTELKLTSVPPHLHTPDHVDKLILSNLQLRELTSISPSVHYLDVTNTSLTEIPKELLIQNITLKLSGNPFTCDCSNEDAVQILKNNKQKILDHSSVICSDQQSPWQIDVPRLCSVRHAVIVGSSLAALSLMLIAVAGLYCRYSMHIKIILYSCDRLRWLVAEEDIDRDKTYDAFVSFSHKDEKFVAQTLVPVLESGPRPLKLCVHYRDWVVGEWIPAQIVSSVEQSRRTIIILSKSFVESVWGTMEFRVAYKRAQEERRTRIIVILLEDAPPEADLDAELRAYLSTNTYIEWGDPWFWEKLRYALAGGRAARRPAAGRAGHAETVC